MIWLELRSNNTKYAPGWNFTESVWAPTKKANGANWPFWNLVGNVIKDDLIFHLQETGGVKRFVGYSTALTDGYTTLSRNSLSAHPWSYSKSFYKVDLTDYQEFNPPIPLLNFFSTNDQELREYFLNNKKLNKSNKKKLFYVIQNKRLQCLNGAYFSEFDINLSSKLTTVLDEVQKEVMKRVETSIAVKELTQRIGHQEFSENVKNNFNRKCCYPNCNVEGKGFLISGHITRWADNEDLRGNTDNGLCLCLIHDKAFEKGFFTLNKNHKVILLKNKFDKYDWLFDILLPGENLEIKPRQINPSIEAIENHWFRIGLQ